MIRLAVAAVFLAIAGCGTPGFVSQAESDGVVVHDAQGARYVVDQTCDKMARGARTPIEVLFFDSPRGYSSSDQHLMELGIAETCPEHSQTFADALKVVSDLEQYVADVEVAYPDPHLNVGPDGYCTATPCGTSGQMPEGVPAP